MFSGYFAREGLIETVVGRVCPVYVIFLYGFFFPLYLLFNCHFLQLCMSSFHCLKSVKYCAAIYAVLWFAQLAIQWVRRGCFPVMRQKGVRLNTYLQLTSRLTRRGAISLLEPYTFMKWTLHVLAFGFHLDVRWLSCNLMEWIALHTAQTRKNAIFSVEHNVYFIQWYLQW